MKKLLATTAVALIAMSGAASAQSVLERVLGSLDAATTTELNGTFANIAENIGSVGSQTVYVDDNGVSISQSSYDTLVSNAATSNVNTITYTAADALADPAVTEGWTYGGTKYDTQAEAVAAAEGAAAATYAAQYNPLDLGLVEGIDGSITNLIDGLTTSTQVASVTGVTATEWNMPTLNFGDMATTALGAVNTGDITLGVNSSVENAKTSSTEAVNSVMTQLGGDSTAGAIVLNVASNMTGVNGSITNTMTEINGTVGALSTTALGAVNTGTIISGVNAAVTGITGASAGQSGL